MFEHLAFCGHSKSYRKNIWIGGRFKIRTSCSSRASCVPCSHSPSLHQMAVCNNPMSSEEVKNIYFGSSLVFNYYLLKKNRKYWLVEYLKDNMNYFPSLCYLYFSLFPWSLVFPCMSSLCMLPLLTHTGLYKDTHHPACVYSCSPDWDDTQYRACDLHGGSDLRLALISDLVSIRRACQGLRGAFHAVIEKLKGS